MTNPNTIAQTLERARGLLSSLAEQRGNNQLRNMTNHVANIEARFADSAEDPTNAIKRLRDFARMIERVDPSAQELVSLLRSAADQLLAGVKRPAAAAA